jgi:hypothetical protein
VTENVAALATWAVSTVTDAAENTTNRAATPICGIARMSFRETPELRIACTPLLDRLFNVSTYFEDPRWTGVTNCDSSVETESSVELSSPISIVKKRLPRLALEGYPSPPKAARREDTRSKLLRTAANPERPSRHGTRERWQSPQLSDT